MKETEPLSELNLTALTTESRNRAAETLDMKSSLDIVRLINSEDARVALAVKKALPAIAKVVDLIATSIRKGGRLIYVGAGTSGRIAAIDATECPPTFSTPPEMVQYVMAGGVKALGAAVEANEDSREMGVRDMARKRPGRKDIVIGVAASGRTPYTVAAVAYAKSLGANTAAVVCNKGSELAAAADIAIEVEVGPEVVSGSTRMKAGTAQKMVLNMLSTGAMARLGYVYGNLMVNVALKNEKLTERAILMVSQAAGVNREKAIKTLKESGKSVPLALIMLKTGVDKPEAVRRLEAAHGNVRQAIEGS